MGWTYSYTCSRLGRTFNQGDPILVKGNAYTSTDKTSIGYVYETAEQRYFYGVYSSDYSYAPICIGPSPGQPNYYIEDSSIVGGGTPLFTIGTVSAYARDNRNNSNPNTDGYFEAVTVTWSGFTAPSGESISGYHIYYQESSDGSTWSEWIGATGEPTASMSNYTFGQVVNNASSTSTWGNRGKYYRWCVIAIFSGGGNSGFEAITPTIKKCSTYTQTFDANGGTDAPSNYYHFTGYDFIFPESVPTRTGYTFKGWSVQGSTTKYTAGQRVSGFSNKANTWLAQWEINTYTITYNANGGSGAPSSQIKTYGTALTLTSSKPTTAKSYTITYNANSGTVSPASKSVSCTFNKWNTKSDGSGTSYNSGGNYTANAAATLYAQWTNPTAGALVTPTRTGYTFGGWYTSATGGTQVTSSTTISKDTTIYAHWTIITYTISYNANGGTGAPSDQIKTYGKALTLSDVKPTRTGYTFKCWNTISDGTGTNYYPSGSYGTNHDMKFYAIWEIITYSITYNLNGGTNPNEIVTTYTVESDTITLPLPTRIGYAFQGWYISSDLSGNSVENIPKGSTENKVYYAKWEPLNVIYYKINGVWKLCNTHIKVDDVWKPAIGYKKINGVWKRSITQ